MQGTRQEPNSIQIGWMRVDFPSAEGLEQAVRLSATDRKRAERFKRDEDRLRFVLGRAILGLLLRQAGLVGAEPLELAPTEQKKPYLPHLPEEHFSITHAGAIVAVALAHGARVGLDVEALDRVVDLAPLAERIFSPADLAQFRSLPEPDQPRAFFRAWTGKEAVLKAMGIGLLGGIEKIAAPLQDEPAAIPFLEGGGFWHLHPLELPSGYAGSVACDTPRGIERHEFEGPQLLD